MIEAALDLVVDELNAYVNGAEGEPYVLLERLVNDDGKYIVGQGKVACTLVNMEEERIVKNKFPKHDAGDFQTKRNPDILLNLYVLFAVNTKIGPGAKNYSNGLKLLSRIVAFFQGKSQFTPQNTPSMPSGLHRLNVELYPMTIESQNSLWAGLGAKYLPSALYKIRMVAISDDQQLTMEPLIQSLSIEQEMGGQA